MMEYNAMFSNPEGVQQIREGRENSFETPDEDFEKLIEEQFGRKLNTGEKGPSIDEMKKTLTDLGKKKKVKNVNNYLNMELDEITFIPFEDK